MALSKQAKILTDKQVTSVLTYLTTTRHPTRNQVMFLLSFKSGLRAKEIGALKWIHVLNSDLEVDDVISLPNEVSKGKSGGRVIPMNKDLKSKLVDLYSEMKEKRWFDPEIHSVILSERKREMSSQVVRNFFKGVYEDMGLVGCSSHSGRRTFATTISRKVSTVGGSLYDVQKLLGHSDIQTTMRYLEFDTDAQRRVVNLL